MENNQNNENTKTIIHKHIYVHEYRDKPNRSSKSNLVALLLCFFLGWFGIHRFYVGKVGSGIAQLLMSCTGILFVVTFVWVLIDFIIICCGQFKDGNNKTLSWDN